MVSKKFLYLMFAISIICVFTGCTKKQTDNKRPSVTENAATKEKSNDSNKEKPVNLVWMTDSTWTDYLSESRKKAEASAPAPISVTVNAAAVIKAPIFLIFLISVILQLIFCLIFDII